MTQKLRLPDGIDNEKMRALIGLMDRWDDIPVENVLVMYVAQAHEAALPFVTELFGLNGPEFQGEAPPLELIKQGILLKKRKGTPWALREVLRRLGYGEVVLVENIQKRYDGTIHYDGEWQYGADSSPFRYAVFATVTAPFTVAQVRALWDVIFSWRPARSLPWLGLRQAGHTTVMYFARP